MLRHPLVVLPLSAAAVVGLTVMREDWLEVLLMLSVCGNVLLSVLVWVSW